MCLSSVLASTESPGTPLKSIFMRICCLGRDHCSFGLGFVIGNHRICLADRRSHCHNSIDDLERIGFMYRQRVSGETFSCDNQKN